jgi:conjugative transfer pilus assembly protein TraH
MHIKLRKFAATTLLLTVSISTANASLQGALDGMWMSNITAVQAYGSETRVGLYGGSMVLRAPIKTYNVAFFDPPRIKAGCNGIDMYFGAFSFISGEELTQLLRNVATAAVPYFFELAIKTMCPTCADIMSTLRKLAHDLSTGELNSCKIGRGAAAFAADKLFAKSDSPAREAITKEAGEFSQMAGTVTNWWDKFKTAGDDIGKLFSGGAAQTQNAELPPKTNTTSNALEKCNALKMIGNDTGYAAGMSEDVIHDILLSITGTRNLPQPGSGNGGDISVAEKQAGEIGLRIDFKSLIDMPAEKKIWSCGGLNNCETPSEVDAHTRFKGTKIYVTKMLFGNENGAPATGGIVNSIVTGTRLTSEQRAFIQSFGLPLMTLFLESNIAGGDAVEHLAMLSSNIMAEEMAIKLGRSFLNGLEKASGCGSAPGLSDSAKENVDNFRKDINSQMGNADQKIQTVLGLINLTNEIRKYNPAIMSWRGK